MRSQSEIARLKLSLAKVQLLAYNFTLRRMLRIPVQQISKSDLPYLKLHRKTQRLVITISKSQKRAHTPDALDRAYGSMNHVLLKADLRRGELMY